MEMDDNTMIYKIKRNRLLQSLQMVNGLYETYKEKELLNDDDEEFEYYDEEDETYYGDDPSVVYTQNECYREMQEDVAQLFDQILAENIKVTADLNELDFYEDTAFWEEIMEYGHPTPLTNEYWKKMIDKSINGTMVFTESGIELGELLNCDAYKKVWLDIYESSKDKESVISTINQIFTSDRDFIQKVEKLEQGETSMEELTAELVIPEEIKEGKLPSKRLLELISKKQQAKILEDAFGPDSKDIVEELVGINNDPKNDSKLNSEAIADSISPRKGEVEKVIEETSQMARQEETTREEQEGQTQGEE